MFWKKTVEVVGVEAIRGAVEFCPSVPFLYVGLLFVREVGSQPAALGVFEQEDSAFPGWVCVDAAEILVLQVTVVWKEVLRNRPSLFMPRVGACETVKVVLEGWLRARATHVLLLGFRVSEEAALAEVERVQALHRRADVLEDKVAKLGEEFSGWSSIDAQVRLLFERVLPHQERRTTPGTPSDESLRQGLRIWIEEVFEVLEACVSISAKTWIDDAKWRIEGALRTAQFSVNLPLLADACADVDMTTAGLRVRCGVDGEPIRQLVHAANMAKAGGPVDAHGKRLKPEGWQPPDVAGELRRQGWEG